MEIFKNASNINIEKKVKNCKLPFGSTMNVDKYYNALNHHE